MADRPCGMPWRRHSACRGMAGVIDMTLPHCHRGWVWSFMLVSLHALPRKRQIMCFVGGGRSSVPPQGGLASGGEVQQKTTISSFGKRKSEKMKYSKVQLLRVCRRLAAQNTLAAETTPEKNRLWSGNRAHTILGCLCHYKNER